jgi:hypothetical protein
MPAKLPDAFVCDPKPVLRDLAIGEEGCVEILFLTVATDKSCWLRAEARIHPRNELIIPVKVRRDETGWHVKLVKQFTWPADFPVELVDDDFLPVESIVVELEDTGPGKK